jgi:hypothetical protein
MKSIGKPVPVYQGSSHEPSGRWVRARKASPRSTAAWPGSAASSPSSAHAVCEAVESPRPIHAGSR